MKKQLLVIATGITLTLNSFAQLGTYNFASYACGGTASVVSQPSNATFSTFTRNTVDCNSVSQVFSSGNWSTGTSYDGNYYIEFSITAAAGYYVALSSLSFDQNRSGTGPSNARVAHNRSGNFTTDFNNFSPAASNNNTTWDFTDINSTVGGTVTFRIYGWNMGNSSGKFQIDNVVLNGTATLAPPAPAASAGSNGTICSGSTATMTGATATGAFSSIAWTGGESVGTWSGSGTNPATYQFTPNTQSGSFTATLTANGSGVWTGTNSTATKTISWAAPGTWVGATDNNWFTSSNWCQLPDANTDVIINTGTYQPNINADGAVCRKLTINSGASINVGIAGRLHIKGNLVNNGTAALGTGSVVFDGPNPQSITGNNDFGTLEVDNSMMISINSGSQTVSGIIILTNGIFYTYGNPLTLKSNASGTAQIAGGGNGDLEGTLTAERYIPVAPASTSPFNHLIASPLKTDTIVDTGLSGFADDFSLVANSYGSSPTGTFFSFLESASGASGSPFSYNCLRAPSQIVNMTGYAAKITSTTTLDITGTYKHHVSPIKNLSYTPGSGGNGWNLVGNPYPSSIDWDAPNGWVKNFITNSIYVWNPTIQQFTSYNGTVGTNGGSRYIAPFQAFFVVANDYYPMISAMQTSRVTSTTSFFKTEEISELIRLKVTGSSGFQDETLVYFDINASQDMDGFDSYKMISMSNEVPMLASRLYEDNVSINALPGYNTETVIPLAFSAPSGNYSISAGELLGFGGSNPVYLEDALTGTIQEITETSSYDFTATGNDENRFSIKFDAPMITGVETVENEVKFYESSGQIIIEADGISGNNAAFSMYNSAGQSIIAGKSVQLNGGRCAVDAPELATGIYIVKLQNGNKEYSNRIYISKAPIF
jgi:hypothetical protein